ncbi:MAG: hypothetical protein AAB793_00965 [Patescibacteria group bacterium]
MIRVVYIVCFTLLGIMTQFIIHALLEKWYIYRLIEDFDSYSLGFTWAQWFLIHHVATVILFAAGAFLGFWQGVYLWRKIYE